MKILAGTWSLLMRILPGLSIAALTVANFASNTGFLVSLVLYVGWMGVMEIAPIKGFVMGLPKVVNRVLAGLPYLV